MSIIVKGMEIPKNCTHCDYIGLNVAIGCPVMSGVNGRATDCPLVELPEKHGKLIDADVMCADLTTVNPLYKTMIDWCIRVTKAQPTVVEAEGQE